MNVCIERESLFIIYPSTHLSIQLSIHLLNTCYDIHLSIYSFIYAIHSFMLSHIMLSYSWISCVWRCLSLLVAGHDPPFISSSSSPHPCKLLLFFFFILLLVVVMLLLVILLVMMMMILLLVMMLVVWCSCIFNSHQHYPLHRHVIVMTCLITTIVMLCLIITIVMSHHHYSHVSSPL